MALKILIFTGAGISVPLGLPTSTGFINQIDQGSNPITGQVRSYLGKTSSDDVEWILSTLESFCTEVAFTEHLIPFLSQGNPHATNGQSYIKNQFTRNKREAALEIKRIKKVIFEKLSSFNQENAVIMYRGLLSELKELYPEASISIATTNYDITFETAIEVLGDELKKFGIEDVEYGFSPKFGRPVYDSSKNLKWNSSTLEFLKVHGSLDWHRDSQGRCSRSGSTTVPDDPDQMAILYPGFKGVPEIEPFVSLHSRLNQRLAEADIVFVVGFAFRDAYINNMFENILRLRKGVKVYYYNPLSLEEHPEGSMAPRLASHYESFQHVKEGIEVSESPLKI